jgi:hypothetical protein
MSWLLNKIKDKFKLLSWKNVKTMFKEHGLALVIIVVGWELVEDIVFPLIFALLGKYVDPMWYAGVPASLLICLHWFMVPVLWGLWMRISNKEPKEVSVDCCSKQHT